jgi:hypothetical protein
MVWMINAPKHSSLVGLALNAPESEMELLLDEWDIRALTSQMD